jgi:tetratricopeptide (TPR) repeat protein
MRVKETTRKEIESKFADMSDYVRIDYLSSCLKNQLDFDTRKFVLVKLAGLFEAKGMYHDAAKAMKSAAEINTNAPNKVNDYVKSIELFIRAGDYDMADVMLKKVTPLLSVSKSAEIEKSVRDIYRIQARASVEKNKRKQATLAYEKLLSFDLDPVEEEDVQNKLLELYEKVGDISQYNKLKKKMFKAESEL